MADKRKEYAVDINGIEHSMLLEPEDAEALYGENAKEVKATRSRKAATASNTEGAAANKAGDAENKGA
ncbi:hypothetical protein [Terrabacter terrigena]|uniref:Lsr2 protein n=1 Tax=Terrabacter terrigena TaxID=574718 RepID=A0ABW3MWS8_9MICO